MDHARRIADAAVSGGGPGADRRADRTSKAGQVRDHEPSTSRGEASDHGLDVAAARQRHASPAPHLGRIAMHVAERDGAPGRAVNDAALVTWPTSRSVDRDARRPAAGTDASPAASHADAHEPLRDAPAAAMQHADDDFLPDVAALGLTDGAIEQSGLERNRLGRHVDAESRPAGVDAHRLDESRRTAARRRRASSAAISASARARVARTHPSCPRRHRPSATTKPAGNVDAATRRGRSRTAVSAIAERAASSIAGRAAAHHRQSGGRPADMSVTRTSSAKISRSNVRGQRRRRLGRNVDDEASRGGRTRAGRRSSGPAASGTARRSRRPGAATRSRWSAAPAGTPARSAPSNRRRPRAVFSIQPAPAAMMRY